VPSQLGTKAVQHMLTYIICLSLGVDNFLSRYVPVEAIHPIPLITFISICIITVNFRTIDWVGTTSKFFFTLFGFGVIVSFWRFYSFYNTGEYVMMPILRQATSLSLGWLTYLALNYWAKRTNFSTMAQAVINTSIFFLIIGLYQKFTNHMVGGQLRVMSLFDEPSYYGDYLVLIIAPCLLSTFEKFADLTRKQKVLNITALTLWLINLYSAQSGTAIIKLCTLMTCFIIFYPIPLKRKIVYICFLCVFLIATIFVQKGYVFTLVTLAGNIYENPSLFFSYHTFYDRIFPIYAATKNFFTLHGLIGFGFGGDYFEFKNLYPESTHKEMLLHKPTFSFFNSYASKTIFYFGTIGVVWFVWLYRKFFKSKNFILKISLLNVLITSLWGIPNFSLPYIWFWLALVETEESRN
jgi:hypothetical protein